MDNWQPANMAPFNVPVLAYNGQWIQHCIRTERGWRLVGTNHAGTCDPTHWRPAPELPKMWEHIPKETLEKLARWLVEDPTVRAEILLTESQDGD